MTSKQIYFDLTQMKLRNGWFRIGVGVGVESSIYISYRIPICTLRMEFLLFGLPCRMLLCYIVQIMLLYANKFMSWICETNEHPEQTNVWMNKWMNEMKINRKQNKNY